MISEERKLQIEENLLLIEKEEGVKVLWACESGSRAWGFASKDSDYDVRFIYLRRTEDYLRVSPLRDVIEKPISDDLDISGWDLTKTLGLFRKSNPPLLEWLQSPIVYREFPGFKKSIEKLMPDYFSPIGCMYHYMSMSKRDSNKCLGSDEIKLKRYFYMLRAVLASTWIQQGLGIAPIEFQTLLDRLVVDAKLRSAIDDLIEKKMESNEVDVGPQIPIISKFIVDQMATFTEVTKEVQFTKEWGPLDGFFRETVSRVNEDG